MNLKRFIHIGAAAAIALAVASPGLARAGIVTPHRIDESFFGSSIDYTNTWAWWGTNQRGLVSFNQGGGVMTLDVSGGAQPDFNVSGQTRCLAHGDFDAQVDFNLVAWPPENGVWVSLMVGSGGFNVYRVSWQFPQTEQYGAYLPPAGNTLPASGTSGTLRLTRHGEIFTAYYRDGRTWVPLVSGTGPTDDMAFTLGVFNLSFAASLSGLPVTVTFDNFHVMADRIVCP